jgi:hypothetical protein
MTAVAEEEYNLSAILTFLLVYGVGKLDDQCCEMGKESSCMHDDENCGGKLSQRDREKKSNRCENLPTNQSRVGMCA